MWAKATSLVAAERDRWILWAPVALAVGDGTYFGLTNEPYRWLGALLLALSALCLLLWRGRPGWPLLVGAVLIAAGFAAAQGRTQAMAAPVLRFPTGIFRLSGRVLAVEPVERGERVVLDRLAGGPLAKIGLERVRIRLRADYDLRPGQIIRLRASLMPPPPPMAPGGYDFTRQAWFQRLGAVGFALGRPAILADRPADSLVERLSLKLGHIRQILTRRIVGAIDEAGFAPGIGTVAAALITGQRGPVPPEILQSYRDAGLAHVLVIAGMHLSMVAGLVLVLLRAILAAIPALALRFPIHKWTACGALLVTFGYLLISGAPVPTQRAFIMNACLLLAILLDRQPVSLRSISLAATAVLLLQPEALISASFQLSFAAVYGLIAGYEALGPRLAAWRQSARAVWQMPLLYFGGILLTTQIAGSATAFYSLFHFSRFAVYSLLGNFLAVPLVGFWVMPSALLAFCLLPFGLDGWGWQAMAAGLTMVSRIAAWVSHLPGATWTAPMMPESALILFSLGAAWLLLWRRRWRLLGTPVMASALILAALHRSPDLLIDGSGKVVALREEDGHWHQSPGRSEKSMRQAWAHLVGEGDSMPLITSGNGLSCTDSGCLYRTDRTERWVPLDQQDWKRQGTHAIWVHDDGPPTVETVAGWQGNRPWRP